MSDIVTPESVRISRLQRNPLQALSVYPYGCDKESVCAEYRKAALLSEPNAEVALNALATYYSQPTSKSREVVHSFSLDTMLRIAEKYPEMVLRVASENAGLVDGEVLHQAHSKALQLNDAQRSDSLDIDLTKIRHEPKPTDFAAEVEKLVVLANRQSDLVPTVPMPLLSDVPFLPKVPPAPAPAPKVEREGLTLIERAAAVAAQTGQGV